VSINVLINSKIAVSWYQYHEYSVSYRIVSWA